MPLKQNTEQDRKMDLMDLVSSSISLIRLQNVLVPRSPTSDLISTSMAMQTMSQASSLSCDWFTSCCSGRGLEFRHFRFNSSIAARHSIPSVANSNGDIRVVYWC